MTWKHLPIPLLLLLLLFGCVRSLHRLYTERDLVFRPELVGVWSEQGESSTWTFRQGSEKSYQLRYVEGGSGPSGTSRRLLKNDTAFFDAHLVQLREHLFLDLFPSRLDVSTNLCMVHMLPVHTIWKVVLKEGEVEMAMLDQEWLQDLAERGLLKIGYERVDGEIVLTAPTAELQEFVVAYAEEPRAFLAPARLKRISE